MKQFFLLYMILMAVSNAILATEKYQENIHYVQIKPAVTSVHKVGRVEVTEVFLFSCPHCFALEPKLQKWLLKHPEVDFFRMPAILHPNWVEMAKFYYIAEKLGVLKTLSDKFYQSIHHHQKHYYNELSIRRFFLENGVDGGQYESAYNSKDLAAKMNQARRLSVQYQLKGVPVIIVNGKYKTAPFYVKNQEEMLEVLTMLVAREIDKF